MPQALDASTGQPVDVAPEELAPKWQSGAVHLVAGQKYHVAMPDGKFYAVPAESLHTALAPENGGRIVSDADVAEHHAQAEYGGIKGGAIAFGTGAAEQGTLGLASELVPKEWQPAIETSQRLHPIATGAGEIAGAAGLSAVLPGGGVAGLAEKGAAALVEGAGESTLARIATRAAVQGAKDTALGAQMGAAQAVSDNAFADHKLAASQIVSTIGANAIWGGALGAGLGALGAGVSSLAGRSGEARAALDRALSRGAAEATDKDVAAAAGKAIGADVPAEGLGGKVRDWYTKVAAAVSGGDREALENFVGKDGYENRKLLLDAEAQRTDASRAIRTHVDTILGASREVQEEGTRSLKRGYIAKAVADVDPAEAARSARTMADQAISKLDEMLKAPEDYGGQAPLKRALTVAQRISDRLDEALGGQGSGKIDVAESFGLVDDLKKSIGKYTKGASRLSPAAATDELISLQNRARAAGLQELYEGLRTGLEDETVWKKAASDQKNINAAWTQQIDASDRFHRALTTETGRDPNDPWRTVRGVDPAKADSYVRNLQNPAQDLTHKAVTDYVSSSQRLAETMAEAYELPPAKVAAVKRLADSADAFSQTLDKTGKTLSLVNQFEALRDTVGGHGANWAALAGAAAGGLPGGTLGMAVGKVTQLFTQPAETIMKLARVEQMMRNSDARIVRALRGFAKGEAKSTERTGSGAFARKSEQVRTLAQTPALMQERIKANLGGIATQSPKLGAALTGMTMSGISFLHDKMPPDVPVDPLNPKAKVPPPSANARASWLRYYDAVKDPIGVVEDLRAGRLSPEGVEVLKKVYPPLYARVQKLAMDEMASGTMKGLTYQKRIGLGLMLDLSLPELAPDYIRQRQEAYAAAERENAAAQAKATQPGGKRKPINLTKAAAPTLSADRVEQGGQP